MSKQEFEKYLAELPEPPEVDWEQVKREWLEHLAELLARIEGWLNGVAHLGVTYQRTAQKLEEEHLGAYEAPAAQIKFKGREVRVEPIGRLIIGARGRADLVGPFGAARLLLVRSDAESPRDMLRVRRLENDDPNDYVWKLALRPPAMGYVWLDENSFYGALMEVVNA